MNNTDFLAAWRGNPFFVLEQKTDATLAEIERAGQRLLALLSINTAGVTEYETPLGQATRDSDQVRQALAALRDPVQRVTWELWANMTAAIEQNSAALSPAAFKWDQAEGSIGWKKQ